MDINEIIKRRRSVYNYNETPVSKDFLYNLLENANWAPTHKLTEPWRFKVFHSSESKISLGMFLAEKFKAITSKEKFSDLKYNKLRQNPQKAAAVIAICMQKDLKKRLPVWEELASTAMAVQNMYLTCTANNIGGYWSSPPLIKFMGEHVPMQEGEECIGFFYIGNYDGELPTGKRTPISDKVIWMK